MVLLLLIESTKNMKVLLTGGSGFIGTNLIGALIKNDEDILNIDIEKPRNPSHFVNWVDCNILDYEHMAQVASNFEPDLLINLAAEMDLNPEFKKFIDVNVGGTALLYELIFKHNIVMKSILM